MTRHPAFAARVAPAAFVAISLGLVLGLGGCVYIEPPRVEVAGDPEQSAEQVLGTYLLLSTLGGGSGDGSGAGLAALTTLYPPRAQLITYAVIGYHREHGAWPTDVEVLRAYAESSPANPRLPGDALDGFQAELRENGDCTYSTREDRQRGRYFTLTPAYRVTMPVPAGLFASPTAPEIVRLARGSTLSVDWKDPSFSKNLPPAPTSPASSAPSPTPGGGTGDGPAP